MSKSDNLNDFLSGVADAIRTKTGTAALIDPQDFETMIGSISTNGMSAEEVVFQSKTVNPSASLQTVLPDEGYNALSHVTVNPVTSSIDPAISPDNIKEGVSILGVRGTVPIASSYVNFYDYDGTLLYAYTLSELNELTALPALPSHPGEGLTADGWNYTLEEIRATGAPVDVGAIYHTTDGLVHIRIRLSKASEKILKLRLISEESATVNWGDGSTSTTPSDKLGVEYVFSHTYSVPSGNGVRDFTVTISTEGALTLGQYLFSNNKTTYNNYTVTEVYLPSDCSVSDSVFYGCTMLKKATIPATVTSIPANCFRSCRNLRHLNVPRGVQSTGMYMLTDAILLRSVSLPYGCEVVLYSFSSCKNLTRICVPKKNDSDIGNYALNLCSSLEEVYLTEGIENISNAAFYGCVSIKKLVFPSTLTAIGGSMFTDCQTLELLDFSALTQVPRHEGSALISTSIQQVVLVIPDELYSSWVTTTGWSNSMYNYIRKSDWDAMT